MKTRIRWLSRPRFRGALLAAATTALLATGCASTAPKKIAGPVFYPPLPNPPRIQYLASFSTSEDVGARRGGLAAFVAGEEADRVQEVRKPYGVALHDGKIYVVDVRGPGYVVFDLVNHEYTFVPGSGPGTMQKPINIAIDGDGTKYVTDTGRNQILLFDKEDRFVRAFGVKDQFNPSDALIVGDRLYVSDTEHHVIQVLDKQTGKVLSQFGGVGDAEGRFRFPTNLTLGPEGNIYVTDTINARVQVFTPEGDFVKSFGQLGDALGQFARPKGVALDREGRMYVVDAAFENVQIFDHEGRLLLFFGGPGAAPENMNLPTVVVIDYDNVELFQKYADPSFRLEYVILVASQFGRSKVNAYGFGSMAGMDTTATEPTQAKRP